MLRRLFVPEILAALTLGAAPDPSFGLGSGERHVRLRAGDHFQCMYRCAERGLEPPTRRYSWGSWPSPRPGPQSFRHPGPRPHPQPHPPEIPPWLRPCLLAFCAGGDWPHWPDPSWCDDLVPWYRHGWYGHYRPYRHCRPHGGHHHDRYDRYRDRDRDHSGGYDAHRHHPRDRDF